jgi:serine/threonine-protein kinase
MALYVGAVLASQLGKTDQAVRLARAEIAADPLRPNAHLLMGLVLFWVGRTAEAEASLEEALQISPTYYDAQYELALVLLSRGKLEKSLHVTESLPEGDQEIGGKLVASAASYSAMGQKLKSDAALATLKKLRADTWAFGIASVYALRGERDQAFPWLDKAIQQRNTDLAGINLEPGVRNLRDDPRYKAILRKMNVPE